eukprot:CAMPEP_0182801436 /NCGR_PEP_ID=MMETSP0006_2-20121128/2952_1 /TAXON_ID=97485 /ORGANISM="Prymnesium parvum, Strain Texoma1" /LENGTH=117 /DNA_ID=CAMNT_0024926759 /DNA_START=338 /DNA_END=691 /DNA_ORIENTATION=+
MRGATRLTCGGERFAAEPIAKVVDLNTPSHSSIPLDEPTAFDRRRQTLQNTSKRASLGQTNSQPTSWHAAGVEQCAASSSWAPNAVAHHTRVRHRRSNVTRKAAPTARRCPSSHAAS